ncbi:MAG: hypothetical protein ACMXX7_03045 [Candidatus Woesearchaeota archaeon]
MFKRGQAAVEFLTTYGWAFFVILAMLGSLSYFGVLDPTSFASDRCIISSPFSCTQFVVGLDGFVLDLRYSLNDRIVLTDFGYIDLNGDFVSCGVNNFVVSSNSRFVLSCPGVSFADYNSLNFRFSYRSFSDSLGVFSRVVSGDLRFSVADDFYVLDASIPNNVAPADLSVVLSSMSGTGASNDPYIITNDFELQAISEDLSGHFRLGDNINLAGTINWNSGLGFEPISGFNGVLDGDGYTIYNLYINRPSSDYVGLFGFGTGSIFDLNLLNVQLHGAGYVGGVSGYHYFCAQSPAFNNIFVSGSIVSSDQYTGGIAGIFYECEANSVGADVFIQSNDRYAGGAFGYVWDSLVVDSFSRGSILGESYSGGFAGTVMGSSSVILRSYSSADVYSLDGPAGGFVGMIVQQSLINQSYALGDVTSLPNIGGFVGDMQTGSIITNSFSLGDVTRLESIHQRVGGFAGSNHQSIITNSFSAGRVFYDSLPNPVDKGFLGSSNTGGSFQDFGNYFDSTSSNQLSSDGNAIGLSSSQMKGSSAQTNMPDLDFTSIWKTSSSYPVLKWMD